MKEVQDIIVQITYRDKMLRPIYTKAYSLQEYADAVRADLQGLVGEVETLGYIANNNKPKDEWDDESFEVFSRIKHKLLDKAGEIGRLPSNMTLRTREPLANYMARLLDGEDDAYGESCVGPGD